MANDVNITASNGNAEFTALVVDDDANIREFTINALRKHSFRCVEAEDGVQALARIGEAEFELMVSDVMMPHKNGHALAIEVVNRPNRPAIIIVTGLMDAKLAEDLLLRGIEDIQFKPVEYNILAAKAEAIVRRRRREKRPLPEPIAQVTGETGHREQFAPSVFPELSQADTGPKKNDDEFGLFNHTV